MRFSNDASGFVSVAEAIPAVLLDIRYYSSFNFIGERIDGYEEPAALLTREAAAALKNVSDEAMGQGWRLKIFDAYRPQKAVDHFVRWAGDPTDIRMKPFFYPELEKKDIIPQHYIAEHSGHTRGSTVDLTLFDMASQRDADMGGTFDYFGDVSHPDYPDITEEQHQNRIAEEDEVWEPKSPGRQKGVCFPHQNLVDAEKRYEGAKAPATQQRAELRQRMSFHLKNYLFRRH